MQNFVPFHPFDDLKQQVSEAIAFSANLVFVCVKIPLR